MTTNNATDTSQPVSVAQGGSGSSSTTTYAVVCGGTSSTAALQPIASVGTSGQVLTSNGAASLPTFKAATGGAMVLLSSQAVSGATDVQFNSLISGTYTRYMAVYRNVSTTTAANSLLVQVSDDGGSTWKATGYDSICWAYTGATSTFTSSTAGSLASEGSQVYNSGVSGGTFFMYFVSSANRGVIEGNTTYPRNTGAGVNGSCVYGSLLPASITINSVRMLMASGNITGTFNLYGIKS